MFVLVFGLVCNRQLLFYKKLLISCVFSKFKFSATIGPVRRGALKAANLTPVYTLTSKEEITLIPKIVRFLSKIVSLMMAKKKLSI
jgi:hypothetical protein